MVLDGNLPIPSRRNAAEELERLITPKSLQAREPWIRYKDIGDCLRGILFSEPLPEAADTEGARKLCDQPLPLAWTKDLILHIVSNQEIISLVRDSWEKIPDAFRGQRGESSPISRGRRS